MDVAVLLRLAPAVLVAVGTAWWIGRRFGVAATTASDTVLVALVVGLVAGRLAWIGLTGTWGSALSTVYLVRAGVETWVGVAAACLWLWWRTPQDARGWLLAAAPAAGLAGVATWHAACQVEGTCAGVPASWGVHLPGYVSRVVPIGYLDAVLAAALAAVAYRWRARPSVSTAAVAGYAAGRALLTPWRATLTTRDAWLSALAAVVAAVVAWRAAGRRLTAPGPGEP